MKTQLITTFLALIISFPFSAKQKKGEIVLAPFRITKNIEDKTLKKTEALFVFSFSAYPNDTIKKDIIYSYNNGKNQIAKPNSKGLYFLKITPGNYKFQFFYDKDFYEITTDIVTIKPGYRIEASLLFISSINPIEMDKPVIYVYPETTKDITILFNKKDELKYTYPTYNTGWNFTASPEGKLAFGDKTYNYIFWEGETQVKTTDIHWNEGFVVTTNNLAAFFEEKLSKMGLTSSEIQDYITYWYPRMSSYDKHYIHFMFTEEFNHYAPLTITPAPDNLFRVFMVWDPLTKDQNIKVKEQYIQSASRTGYTVVEWGGTELNYFQLPIN